MRLITNGLHYEKILLAGFSWIGLGVCDNSPTTSEPVKFEKVYQIEGLNQAQVYDGARQWFATAFDQQMQ